jgi:hypothetical protein
MTPSREAPNQQDPGRPRQPIWLDWSNSNSPRQSNSYQAEMACQADPATR